MMASRKATIFEKFRKWYHRFPWVLVLVPSLVAAWILQKYELIGVLIEECVTLSVTGAGIAAFLFAIQSSLISVPKENPFMQEVRKDGSYLILIHRFCRIAEMTFMLIMLPMFFMDNESGVLNFLVISAYIAALLFTVWSMYLMGRILILSEKHSHN